MIERKWIAYQILEAVRTCHEASVYHGDIKTDNFVLTTWNWVCLTDFASYKPVFLPDTDPSVFSYFFDSTGRRTCYLAPERLQQRTFSAIQSTSVDSQLNAGMDVFSVGCVFVELFLDSHEPLFDLGSLRDYRDGNYDPTNVINGIEDKTIVELIRHMIQVDPKQRLSIGEYLTQYTGTIFPKEFQYVMYPAFLKASNASYDGRIRLAYASLAVLEEDVTLTGDLWEAAALDQAAFRALLSLSDTEAEAEAEAEAEIDTDRMTDAIAADGGQDDFLGQSSLPGPESSLQRREDPLHDATLNTALKEFIVRLEESTALTSYETAVDNAKQRLREKERGKGKEKNPDPGQADPSLAVSMHGNPFFLPSETVGDDTNNDSFDSATHHNNGARNHNNARSGKQFRLKMSNLGWKVLFAKPRQIRKDDRKGHLSSLLAPLICSSLGHCTTLRARLIGLSALAPIGDATEDNVLLELILPHIIHHLRDEHPAVRALAVRLVALVLSGCYSFPLHAANYFPAYVMPALWLSDPDDSVRLAYAEAVPVLAEAAQRFLEIAQFTKGKLIREGKLGADRDGVVNQGSYEAEHALLVSKFRELFVRLLRDPSFDVPRVLLSQVDRICTFCGTDVTREYLLPLFGTLLNEPDHRLHVAYCTAMISVGSYLGPAIFTTYILPFLVSALISDSEAVVTAALKALGHSCELSLMPPLLFISVIQRCASLLIHPSGWLRAATAVFAAKGSLMLKPIRSTCLLLPILSPFLVRFPGTLVSATTLLECLAPPVSWEDFQKAFETEFAGDSHDLFSSSIAPKSLAAVEEQFSETVFPLRKNNPSLSPASEKLLRVMAPWLIGTSRRQRARASSVASVAALERPNSAVESKQGEDAMDLSALKRKVYLPESTEGFLLPMSDRFMVDEAVKRIESWGERAFDLPSESERQTHAQWRPSTCISHKLQGSSLHSYLADYEKNLTTWRPHGVLTASLRAHLGPVNQVATAADCIFFVSCSDDGSVKLWDLSLMEMHTTSACKVTYGSQGGRILSVSIVKGSHQIASGSTGGTVSIFDVEYTSNASGGVRRYTGTSEKKVLRGQNGGAVVKVQYLPTASDALLFYGTQDGNVAAWDMRSSSSSLFCQAGDSFGLLTSFLLDPAGNWMLTSSYRGFLSLWDLRKQQVVKEWRDPCCGPIYSVEHCITGTSPTVLVSSGKGQFSEWSLNDIRCRRLFQTRHATTTVQESMLIPQPSPPPAEYDFALEDFQRIKMEGEDVIKSLWHVPGSPIVVSGSRDGTMRCWDMTSPHQSYVMASQTDSSERPVFTTTMDGQIIRESMEIPSLHSGENFPSFSALPTGATPGHLNAVSSIASASWPEMKLVTGGRDGFVKVWL